MSVPIRATNITAASTNLADIMAAIWADIGANSQWTQVTETNTAVAGDLSFAIRSPGGGLELNFSNDDLGTPDVDQLRVGINPDGAGAAIVNSEDPSADATNFSGTDRGKLLDLSTAVGDPIGNVEFIWLEWGDAIMALFKNPARTAFPKAIHAGKTLFQPIAALENPGGGSQIRMDGNAIWGQHPGYVGSNFGDWLTVNTTYPHAVRKRYALGQSVEPNANIHPGLNAWSASGKQCAAGRTYGAVDSDYKFGSSSERIPLALFLTSDDGTRGCDCWVANYVRMVSPFLPPFSTFQVNGADTYMVLGHSPTPSATVSQLAVVIPDSFNPNP